MRHPVLSTISLFLFMLSSPIVQAHHLLVKNIWIPEAPPVSKVLAGFMVIQNRSNRAVNIIDVSSPDFSSIEMHLSKEIDGVAKMLPQKQLTIPAQGQLVLKPGSYHLMLFNPRKVFTSGDSTEITLTLDDGEKFTIRAKVKKSAMKMMDHSKH